MRAGIMLAIIALTFVGISCLNLGCKKGPPVESPSLSEVHALELAAEDASCTEAWLRVTVGDVSLPQIIQLRRDGQIVSTLTLPTSDSLIVDTSLSASRNYTYKAYRLSGSQLIDSSSLVTLTTLDSSSNNWVFDQPVLLGDGSGSVLRDVIIVSTDPPLAYACGEIYVASDTFPHLPYNLAKWDGDSWELKRVTVMFRGNSVTLPLEGIWAHSPSDIWLMGSIPIHGDGVHWIGYDIQTLVGAGATVSRMWGTPSEMYFVGRAGNIIRYIPDTWLRWESGTTLPINDIFGAFNQKTEEWEILCVASNQFTAQGMLLLSIANGGVTRLPATGLSWALNTVWHVPGRKYIVGGDGIYLSRTVGPVWVRDTSFPPYYKTAVRGTGLNQIAVVGAWGLLMTYNGVSWRSYHDQTFMSDGAFGRVDVKGNMLVAVGGKGNKGVALIGRRQ